MRVLSYSPRAVFFLLMVFSGGVFAGTSYASWAGMTMSELVAVSDAVVVGEVVDVRPAPSDLGMGSDIGIIRLTEVLSGGNNDAELMILFPSERARVKTSVDLMYKVGQKGIWFLRKKPDSSKGRALSIYLADHPQRLMDIEHLETVRGFIKARTLER